MRNAGSFEREAGVSPGDGFRVKHAYRATGTKPILMHT